MPYLNFNSASPALKFIITVMAMATIGVIIWFMGFMLSRIIFQLDVREANEVISSGVKVMSLSQLKYNQMLQTIAFFIVPGIFLHWLFSTPSEPYFGVSKKPSIYSGILILLTLILGIPFVNYLIEYNYSISFPAFLSKLEASLKVMEQAANSYTVELLSVSSFGAYLVNILMIAILPAIGEEYIFRGVFQKIFFNLSKNKHMAIVLAAILFSAVHAQFYGFIPRFLLGVFFGYLMIWSKTVWLPILAHFFNNAMAVTIYYVYNKGIITVEPDKLGLDVYGIIGVLLSVLLVVVGIYLIKRNENSNMQTAS